MTDHEWIREFSAAITVCDSEGVILDMNDRAIEFNHRQGETLIGSNIVDCHPDAIKPKAKQLVISGEKHINVIEQDGKWYITYYAPWYKDGNYSGLVEFILGIPPDKKHLFRKPS